MWLFFLGIAVGVPLAAFLVERRRRRTSAMAGGLHEDIALPHTTEWELYHNSFSLCSKKLRVCMEELGLPYTSHPIELIETGAYENVSRHFLAVNPAGLVPVLVHRGHPIYESHEEIVYAAQHAGERGRELLGMAGDNAAQIEHWKDLASLVGDDPTRGTEQRAGHCVPGLTVPIFATMCQYVPFSRFVEGLLFHPQKRRPVILGLLKLVGIQRIPKLPPAMGLITRSRRDMDTHLDALEKHLADCGGPWLAGDRFTLADVSWIVILDRIVEVDWEAYFWSSGKRPHVAAYWDRLRSRPSYAKAILEARCETLERGIADVKRAKDENPELRAALEGTH